MINNSIAIETPFYSISVWQAVLKVNVMSREEAGGRSRGYRSDGQRPLAWTLLSRKETAH